MFGKAGPFNSFFTFGLIDTLPLSSDRVLSTDIDAMRPLAKSCVFLVEGKRAQMYRR